ncbi:MAG TPA: hypothetical protein GXZ77_04290 [Papillibacter sp.]|jgi:hypothetical protein|nr:hypothetical protein [Papillibacter sp.]
MRILIVIVVFIGCFLYDGFTRLDKAPKREIVVYVTIMLVSMIVPVIVYYKRVDIPSPTYAIEKVIDLFFHIKE